MAITYNSKKHIFREATSVTSGNEVIFEIPQGAIFVLEAIPDGSGQCTPYTTCNPKKPSGFSDMVAIIGSGHNKAFQESPICGGQRWVGVQVQTGTWHVTVTLADKGARDV